MSPRPNSPADQIHRDRALDDDEDDLNEALLQASDEFESKIMPHETATSLALALCKRKHMGLVGSGQCLL